MKGYLSVRGICGKWKVFERWVNQNNQEAHVSGAERIDKSWTIPEDAEKTEHQKSGVNKERKKPNEWFIF